VSATKEAMEMDASNAKSRRAATLATPTGLGESASKHIGGALTALLADSFALYIKTKNFHWHMR